MAQEEKVDLWMPFYVGDYLADTMHLSAAEHGGYLMLILHYWKSGPIPDDDARLAIISRLGDAWGSASSIIRAFFKQRDGMLVHERIDREKVSASSNKSKKVAKAKAAADARWKNNPPSNAPSMPQAKLEGCPSPSPSPSPDGELKNIGAGAPGGVERRAEKLEAIENDLSSEVAAAQDLLGATPVEPEDKAPRFDGKRALLAEGVDAQIAADFLLIRTRKRAPFTKTAMDGMKREAQKAGYTVAQAVTKCCEKGWQGFEARYVENTPPPRASGRPSINATGDLGQGEADPFDDFRRG